MSIGPLTMTSPTCIALWVRRFRPRRNPRVVPCQTFATHAPPGPSALDQRPLHALGPDGPIEVGRVEALDVGARGSADGRPVGAERRQVDRAASAATSVRPSRSRCRGARHRAARTTPPRRTPACRPPPPRASGRPRSAPRATGSTPAGSVPGRSERGGRPRPHRRSASPPASRPPTWHGGRVQPGVLAEQQRDGVHHATVRRSRARIPAHLGTSSSTSMPQEHGSSGRYGGPSVRPML